MVSLDCRSAVPESIGLLTGCDSHDAAEVNHVDFLYREKRDTMWFTVVE